MAIFEHYRDQIHSAAHAIFVLRAIKDQIARTSDIGTYAISTANSSYRVLTNFRGSRNIDK